MSKSILTTLIIAAQLISTPASSQANWTLASRPRFSTEGEQIFRIRGASFASQGRIVVSSGGSKQLVVIGPTGAIQRSIGRSGEGPGEFRGIDNVVIFGDTIVVYDGALNRVSRFLLDGKFLDTKAFPNKTGERVLFQDALSPTSYVVTSHRFVSDMPNGTSEDLVDIGLYNANTAQIKVLGRRRWATEVRYNELKSEYRGSSSYNPPFWGRGAVAAGNEVVLYASSLSPTIEIISTAGNRAVRAIAVPFTQKRFTPTIINAYRDSLIQLAVARKDAPTADRIRKAFTNLPAPTFFPVTRGLLTSRQSLAWVEAFPEPGVKARKWAIVDMSTAKTVATVSVPNAVRVLAVSDGGIIGLTQDEDGTEFVSVIPLIKK